MAKTQTTRTVTFLGATYKVRGAVEIPNLDAMDRIGARMWLCRHTYARGYSRPNPLAGLAGAITVSAR